MAVILTNVVVVVARTVPSMPNDSHNAPFDGFRFIACRSVVLEQCHADAVLIEATHAMRGGQDITIVDQ